MVIALSLIAAAGCYTGGGDGDGSGDGSDAGTDGSGDTGSDVGLDSGSGDVGDDVDAADTDDDSEGPIYQCLLDCGMHGVCQVADAAQFCSCDEGWEGEACEACADGWQDNDDDGECAVACGSASAPDCAFQLCDDSSGAALCTCGRGMVLSEAGDACVFGTWPDDPDFTEGSGWTATAPATISPDEFTGTIGPGFARFPGATECTEIGLVSQTVPFAAVPWGPSGFAISSSFACDLATGSSCDSQNFWVNGRLANFSTSDTFLNEQGYTNGCLPASAAGGDLDIVVAQQPGRDCGSADSLLAGVGISAVGARCVGTTGLRDGGFDAELGGTAWLSTFGIARITPVLGNRALELRGGACAPVTASQIVSLDDDIASPALVAEVDIPGTRQLVVAIAGVEHTFEAGTSQVTVCMDASVPRAIYEVSFSATGDADSCEMAPFDPVRVDNVRVVSEPSCANRRGVVGGSFEAFGWTAWRFGRYSEPVGYADVDLRLLDDETQVLRLAAGSECATATAGILIGGPNAVPGDALRFDYRALSEGGTVDVSLLGVYEQIVGTPLWTTYERCLTPWSEYSSAYLGISARVSSDCSPPVDLMSRAYVVEIDNVEIVESDACP